jgi:hypothetical protein
MGGEGSGRLPSEATIAKRMCEPLVPVAHAGDNIFLPNYSGLKPEAKKGQPYGNNLVTANDDGTYITLYANGTALLRIVKATSQVQVQTGIDTDTTF